MKRLSQTHPITLLIFQHYSKFIIVCFISLFFIEASFSEIINGGFNVATRVRWGSQFGVDRVTFNASIPSELGGLVGITGQPETAGVANNNTGTGVFDVRIVTDSGRRIAGAGPFTATYNYDSSAPMTCQTPASCGTENILFSKIRWNFTDNDTLNIVTQYNDSAAQFFNSIVDTNVGGRSVRHRNFYQYIFINDTLLPAGTYQGTVTVNGQGTF